MGLSPIDGKGFDFDDVVVNVAAIDNFACHTNAEQSK